MLMSAASAVKAALRSTVGSERSYFVLLRL
jgi:hypothetical protein